ncbi:uncharacterized protein LOC143286130 [Babylonia areolata]|uniref:uncharacterized protein LOC143286130 n=1 Tax=Babylonia areolata TaxID=304850 RepID=UPI003FD246A1
MAQYCLPVLLTGLVWAAVLKGGLCEQNSDCSNAGPGDCTFAGTFCNWTAVGWTTNGDHVKVSSSGDQHSATLRSRVVCAANTPHCLRFHFSYDGPPGGALDVFVEQSNDRRSRWRIEPTSSTSTWQDASVYFVTTSEFRVMFQATWDAGQNSVFSLQNVTYENADCEMSPPEAFVPSGGSYVRTTTEGTSKGAEGCRVQFVVLGVCFLLWRCCVSDVFSLSPRRCLGIWRGG